MHLLSQCVRISWKLSGYFCWVWTKKKWPFFESFQTVSSWIFLLKQIRWYAMQFIRLKLKLSREKIERNVVEDHLKLCILYYLEGKKQQTHISRMQNSKLFHFDCQNDNYSATLYLSSFVEPLFSWIFNRTVFRISRPENWMEVTDNCMHKVNVVL